MISDNTTTTISNLYKELWIKTQDSNILFKKIITILKGLH